MYDLTIYQQFDKKSIRQVKTLFLKAASIKYKAWRYASGRAKANYPMPAIRQHFEFGWDLNLSEPVLMYVVSGPYEG